MYCSLAESDAETSYNLSPYNCDLELQRWFFSSAVISLPFQSSECQLDISYLAGRLQEILADTYHTTLSGRYPVNWICWADSLPLCQSQIPLKESRGNSFSVKLQVYSLLCLSSLLVFVMVLWESVGFSPQLCFISAVPGVAPKRVRARSLSAAQIEVIWEALHDLPERVLGYEVWFIAQSFSFFKRT